jgi:hypothetical protein
MLTSVSKAVFTPSTAYTIGVNGDRMDTTVTENQKRDQESNNTSFDKVENNKHPSAEEEQNTVRNKLKKIFK